MTAIWHVDNLLVSCKDAFELTKLQCYLGRIYGQGLTIKRGNKHDYIGMNLTFCKDGEIECEMFDYVDNVINVFSEEV